MKRRKTLPARFFCANCGSEVAPGTPRCPRCRRQFTAVRCPRCSFEGGEEDFRAGCPACGHLRPTLEDPSAGPQGRGGRGSRRGWAAGPAPWKMRRDPLPRRFYLVAGLGLAVAAIVLLALLLLSP